MASFDNLWKNFPDKDKIVTQCRNKQKDSNNPFDNYCGIMLSECLLQSGIDLSLYKGSRCWSHNGKKHILLAEDLARGLKKHPPAGFGALETIRPESFQNSLSGRTGVIFFKDYWQRGSESFNSRSGDHVDLWNKNAITSSGMFLRSILEFLARVSDLNKSKEIWFWEVK